MKNALWAAGQWCSRVLARTWFLITESDPPEKRKKGIRVFGPRTRRAPEGDRPEA